MGLLASAASPSLPAAAAAPALQKVKDLTVYSDASYYNAFPSIVRRPNGELLVAFRRAPNRRQLGHKGVSHTDPNSYLVMVRSRDNGETWTTEPELIFAHPMGGSQDPGLLQLRDGSLLCTSYLWTWLDRKNESKSQGTHELDQYVFQGGYLVRSTDNGRSWQGPIVPPPVPGRTARDAWGKPLPAYNRGAICQGKDGRLYWPVAYAKGNGQTDVHLMISQDGGLHWEYSCVVASDEKVTFNEASAVETAKGDLLVFLRTANFNDHTVVARSRDGGKSFGAWEDAGWQGHPHHALRLADGRIYLVYGYRHAPFGIRARMLNPDGSDVATAPEVVLRDDGGGSDLGYPWSVALPNRRILTVYYFQQNNGPRSIAGTVLGY